MQRTKRTGRLLGAFVVLVVAGGTAWGQAAPYRPAPGSPAGIGTGPVGPAAPGSPLLLPGPPAPHGTHAAPVSADCPQCAGGPRLPWGGRHSDKVCQPDCCAYPHLYCPFQVYVRTGPAIITGTGLLDAVLETGYAVEAGVKTFLYDDDHRTAAWTASLGIDYLYNNADLPAPVIKDRAVTTVRELHRTYVHIAGGREWYWETPRGWDLFAGIDAGGRLGSAHAKFNTEPHKTDAAQAIFIGLDAGVLIPRCGYDLLFGGRFEWSHDWVELIEFDNELDQMKFLLTAGIRY
jgi:hypothetical protein